MKVKFSLVLLFALQSFCDTKTVGYKNIELGGVCYYAFTPGFPEAHSIWSAIGITDQDQVYVGVADHAVNVGIFHYDPRKDAMTYLGDVLAGGKLWLHEWQGKVHTGLAFNPKDGLVYFGTDAGNSLWEYVGVPDQAFVGGHWFSIDPKTDLMSDLGLGVRYLGLKSIAINASGTKIFSTTDPSSHFVVFDLAKAKSTNFDDYRNAALDLGCINGVHEPRMTWCDLWDNAYTVNEIGLIVKYDDKTGEIRRTSLRVPFAPGTPNFTVGSGASAVVPVEGGKYHYAITYYGRIFKHVSSKEGEGALTDLGSCWGEDTKYHEDVKVGCLAMGKNGKLYYVLGGHGYFITKDKSAVLMEFDPATRQKKVIYAFDQIVTECTGGVTDSQGNIFFAAHGQSVPQKDAKAIRKPYLVKFHPDKIKRVALP